MALHDGANRFMGRPQSGRRPREPAWHRRARRDRQRARLVLALGQAARILGQHHSWLRRKADQRCHDRSWCGWHCRECGTTVGSPVAFEDVQAEDVLHFAGELPSQSAAVLDVQAEDELADDEVVHEQADEEQAEASFPRPRASRRSALLPFPQPRAPPLPDHSSRRTTRISMANQDGCELYTFTEGTTGVKKPTPQRVASPLVPLGSQVGTACGKAGAAPGGALREVDRKVLAIFHRHVFQRYRSWKSAWIEGFDCLSADDNETIERADFCSARLFDGFGDSPHHVWSLLDPHAVGEITFKTLRGPS